MFVICMLNLFPTISQYSFLLSIDLYKRGCSVPRPELKRQLCFVVLAAGNKHCNNAMNAGAGGAGYLFE